MDETIEAIKDYRRSARFAMKMQQKMDRHLDAFVLRNMTDWSPDMDEKERKREKARCQKIINDARAGKGDPSIISKVAMTDLGRAPADEERKVAEKEAANLAKSLPVYPFVKDVRGFSENGLAGIIGEAGDLGNYSTFSKLWKRLGFAPYDGLAGSTWKREKWRPRKLTADEWKQNPFSGERYAIIHQYAVWIRNAQCEAKDKSGTLYGRPTGHYGALYVRRREDTARTHPDWTMQHAHMDALRYMMKKFLRDLWRAWRATTQVPKKATSNLPATPSEGIGVAAE